MGLDSVQLGPLFMGDLGKDLLFCICLNHFESDYMHFFDQVILDIKKERYQKGHL